MQTETKVGQTEAQQIPCWVIFVQKILFIPLNQHPPATAAKDYEYLHFELKILLKNVIRPMSIAIGPAPSFISQ